MNLNANYFELFELPATFRQEPAVLDRAYRELQTRVHPDKFAHLGDAQRRLSMQWATQANEAYRTLKKPLARAQYLLHLRGADVGAENNTAMPAAFLMEQMEWREAVEDARRGGKHGELESLRQRLGDSLGESYATLAEVLDDRYEERSAAEAVRKLMFLEKLAEEIDDSIAEIEDH